MLLYLSLWVCFCVWFFCMLFHHFCCFFGFFRADALAGVRKQGCKSLSQAYCMVSTGGLEACFLSIYITPKMLSKYMFHLFSVWSMMLSYIYCSSVVISDFLLFQVKPWDHCFFMLRCFDDSVHYFKVPSQTSAMATRKVR